MDNKSTNDSVGVVLNHLFGNLHHQDEKQSKKKKTKNYKDHKVICCNCGKPGHVYRKCFQPITSIGVICIATNGIDTENLPRKIPRKQKSLDDDTSRMKFIFIRRKDSLSFSEITLAKYRLNNKEYIKKMLSRMTIDELEFLKNVRSADDIWSRLWTSRKKRVVPHIRKKLQSLIDGVVIKDERYSFRSLIEEIEPRWNEPEWGFPKGRRIPKESDVDCALREFQEETDIPKDNIQILPVNPIEEIFVGSNGVRYRHVYFLASCKENFNLNLNPRNKHQKAEISAIRWLEPSEILNKIRDDHPERKQLVIDVANFIKSSIVEP